ncbi:MULTISPECIES: ribulose-phosphate 3-epimerase [Pseudonocardia]|uniref:Ribulose-phosphate 3-epimerase n=2 Tax=Pseudonocardia TaxID=1847 RepID=A0A1Y2MI62_PSEAH|nr:MULTISPECIES: ribulose-phosphate 3-epimerase [Pseudonocardia]OSY34649.1 Ribulose-phosphate 3-epimerase [Pseudonocardia autotrophica]TDN76417.1 ribulose-5-phosphate 3-epimerase [Pseudonocardia autotrophica]BBG00411.1 ribulose-phosphate 3-epimerase [Pseudonocardia autotrophica]GEC29499.1 ribulose-phosphate 3-epimerase [Pseudonocardia saturnea]
MASTTVPTLVASVLPADFADLGGQVKEIEKAGVDRIQWDVMDGRFVPNITFGPDVIAACRGHVQMGFEAHLMVDNPDPMLPRWVEAGCGIVIVHAESTGHLHRTLGAVRELGARAGVALNPATPLAAVEDVLEMVDLLLIMTVNPGFGGQAYIASMEPKIARARAEIERRGLDIELEVDGGIGAGTIGGAATAGANVFCAGSSLFTGPGTMAERTSALRAAAAGSAVGA